MEEESLVYLDLIEFLLEWILPERLPLEWVLWKVKKPQMVGMSPIPFGLFFFSLILRLHGYC